MLYRLFLKDSGLVLYLSGRRQRVVFNGKFSKWVEVLAGVPQGSILDSLLFLFTSIALFNILLALSHSLQMPLAYTSS